MPPLVQDKLLLVNQRLRKVSTGPVTIFFLATDPAASLAKILYEISSPVSRVLTGCFFAVWRACQAVETWCRLLIEAAISKVFFVSFLLPVGGCYLMNPTPLMLFAFLSGFVHFVWPTTPFAYTPPPYFPSEYRFGLSRRRRVTLKSGPRSRR